MKYSITYHCSSCSSDQPCDFGVANNFLFRKCSSCGRITFEWETIVIPLNNTFRRHIINY